MKNTHIVYWIYNTKTHTDPMTEGYIGVTSQRLVSRLNHHKNVAKNGVSNILTDGKTAVARHLKNEELADIGIRPITRKISKELAYKIEGLMRPSTNVGWNGYKGGSIPNEVKPIIVTSPDGQVKEYNSIAEAARDGLNRGNLQHVLSGRRKEFNFGHTARYK